MNIEQHLRQRVEHFTQVVNRVYPSLIFAVPNVEFFNNKKASGYAIAARHTVQFNTVLAAENIDKFDNTVIHELAHLVTKRRHPFAKQPHGPEFKGVMADLGGRPNRGHTYDVSNVKARTRVVERNFHYVCSCKKLHFLTAVRHNRVQKGVVYRCVDCRVKLIPYAEAA